MLSVRSAPLTDIGHVRRENEDRFLIDEQMLLFGVADGVGGLPGGGEAAQLAVEDVAGALHSLPRDREPDLTKIVHHTNEVVAALGKK